MTALQLQKNIIATVCDYNSSGLSVGTSGNLSARHDNGFMITPTGVAYADLKPGDIVHCNLNGEVIKGRLIPSSEWPFHSAIYSAKDEVNAIVHVHSPYATAIACTRESIPAFHYMVAVAGGDQIPCADYATFGTDQLSENVVAALRGYKACLLANHGLVATGDSISTAYKLAHEVELLAMQYTLSLRVGKPVLLDEKEMQINIEKFKTYGKQKGE